MKDKINIKSENINTNMELNPEIWGPHYWFVLHTIAITYPLNPNDTVKKKYYDFIQNLPLFLPNEKISNSFIRLLDKYPVSPYLDSRISFMKWMHFIHNKINEKIDKPLISFYKSLDDYYYHYKPKEIQQREFTRNKQYIIYVFTIILLVLLVLFLYNK